MGLCYSKDDNGERQKNAQIDKQLEKEKIKQEYKILLLGLIQNKQNKSFQFL
jgi:guanine nucleotide-binding protein subunit alpha